MGLPTTYYQQLALALYPETPKIIAPAMNTYMYQTHCPTKYWHFKEVGYQEIIPREALLACGDYGRGALATVEDILQTVMKILASDNKE